MIADTIRCPRARSSIRRTSAACASSPTTAPTGRSRSAARTASTCSSTTVPEGGKGPALRWAISQLDPADDDVVVVVDADTVVDADMLRELDVAFAVGAVVAQGYYGVRDAGSSASEGFRAAALATRHHLRPLGRNCLGGSSGLYGNGMAFRASVFRRHGVQCPPDRRHGVATQLLLDGHRRDVRPQALDLAAQMPSTLADAKTQNERWERGRSRRSRGEYLPRLARAVIRPRAWTSGRPRRRCRRHAHPAAVGACSRRPSR